MRQITAWILMGTLPTFAGCSYEAHNYLGAWRDENNIPHFVYKSGAVHLLTEPSPSPPWRYGTLVPYTINRDDVAPDEITAAHGSMRFEREQLRPDPSAYRFVHLADIQVRDRCVGLGPGLRELAKVRTSTVEASYYGDHADVFYLAYVLDAIREGVVAGHFDAVVHGGDAVQLGVRSEFRAFDYFMETFLRGPSSGSDCWLYGTIDVDAARLGKPPTHLNMIGNHGRFFMGSFTRRFVVMRWTETDTPVESLDGWPIAARETAWFSPCPSLPYDAGRIEEAPWNRWLT